MLDLLALIQSKNAAFAALERADRALDRRYHSHTRGNAGPVPAEWLGRRAELATDYDRALRVVQQARSG